MKASRLRVGYVTQGALRGCLLCQCKNPIAMSKGLNQAVVSRAARVDMA